MTYTKPEMDIEKFDIIEDIAADGASAGNDGGSGGASINSGAIKADESIGSDLIIG